MSIAAFAVLALVAGIVIANGKRRDRGPGPASHARISPPSGDLDAAAIDAVTADGVVSARATEVQPPSVVLPGVPGNAALLSTAPGAPQGGGARYIPSVAGSAPAVLDVRTHSGTPPPPMGPFAAYAGSAFQQVGFVFSVEEDKRFPLYARPTPYHRNGRTQYYVGTRDAHVQVSPRVGGRDCADDLGCEEMSDGDKVSIPELSSEELTVKLYRR